MLHDIIKNSIYFISSEAIFFGLCRYIKLSNYALVNYSDLDEKYPICELNFAKHDFLIVSIVGTIYIALTCFLFKNILENEIVIVFLSLLLAILSRYKIEPNENMSLMLKSVTYNNAYLRTLTLAFILYNIILPFIIVINSIWRL